MQTDPLPPTSTPLLQKASPGGAGRAGRVKEAIQPTLIDFSQNCLVITENVF